MAVRNRMDCLQDDMWKYPGEKLCYLMCMDDGKVTDSDGSHSDASGVAKARKLIEGIFGKGRHQRYVMLTIEPVPDMDVPVNDEAMQACAMMVKASK